MTCTIQWDRDDERWLILDEDGMEVDRTRTLAEAEAAVLEREPS